MTAAARNLVAAQEEEYYAMIQRLRKVALSLGYDMTVHVEDGKWGRASFHSIPIKGRKKAVAT